MRAVDAILSMETYSGSEVKPETMREIAEVIDQATGLPELLAVCKLLASRMYDSPTGRTAIEMAKAAIAKTEGK